MDVHKDVSRIAYSFFETTYDTHTHTGTSSAQELAGVLLDNPCLRVLKMSGMRWEGLDVFAGALLARKQDLFASGYVSLYVFVSNLSMLTITTLAPVCIYIWYSHIYRLKEIDLSENYMPEKTYEEVLLALTLTRVEKVCFANSAMGRYSVVLDALLG
jgi:hypothetical protein